MLHKNTNKKISKDSSQLIDECLNSVNVPDLASNQRKLLTDEIPVSKDLVSFILALSEPVREKVRAHDEIVKLSDIAFTLHSRPDACKLMQDYLKNPKNIKILNNNRSIKNAAYILMKNNKDAFQTQELISDQKDLGKSTLSNLGKSTLLTQSILPNKSLINNSQIQPGKSKSKDFVEETQNKEDKAKSIIQKNIKTFGEVMDSLLNEESARDIFEEYITALNDF